MTLYHKFEFRVSYRSFTALHTSLILYVCKQCYIFETFGQVNITTETVLYFWPSECFFVNVVKLLIIYLSCRIQP